MTRAAAFLSAALLAASLGVAQNTSTSGTASHQNNASTTITTSNQGSAVNSGRTDATRVEPSRNADVAHAETSDLSDDMNESLGQNPQPNSTALQLLGLIGVGSLIAGFFMRR